MGGGGHIIMEIIPTLLLISPLLGAVPTLPGQLPLKKLAFPSRYIFLDIRSKDTKIVKNALGNILAALKQRSQALAVTSVGKISRQNMRLITMEELEDDKRNKERDKRVEEILELS